MAQWPIGSCSCHYSPLSFSLTIHSGITGCSVGIIKTADALLNLNLAWGEVVNNTCWLILTWFLSNTGILKIRIPEFLKTILISALITLQGWRGSERDVTPNKLEDNDWQFSLLSGTPANNPKTVSSTGYTVSYKNSTECLLSLTLFLLFIEWDKGRIP